MDLLAFLLLFPLAVSVLLLVLPNGRLQGWVVKIGATATLVASVFFVFAFLGQGKVLLNFEAPWMEKAVLAADVLIGLFLLERSFRLKKGGWWVPLMVLAQLGVMGYCDLSGRAPTVTNSFLVDPLSILMVHVVGVVGSLIAIYSVSYMSDYHHHHPELHDDRRLFFSCLFLFLSAMFGVVLANHLSWLYLCWEITTLSSFLMIGYLRNEESLNNAFRALAMNLLGGLAFALAILTQTLSQNGTLELDKLSTPGAMAALLPIALLSFAGITKSAQLPFSSWLLGAMVAPTPVSALLHSSTMVKAGVYLILRFSPAVQGTSVGFLLGLIGGVTFLVASLAAVTQSDAKRVLAHSTIANLGLIVACAGVGTAQAYWAGMLLLLFHAVSKGLLFLGVGAVEHRIGSRNIEDMDGLMVRQKGLAIVLLIGILGMFLAPFGMLISKWATLKALVDVSPPLAVLLAFGSGPTLFFWSKWMGKLVSIPGGEPKAPQKTPWGEWAALVPLSVMTVAACAFFPLLSSRFLEPYLQALYGTTVTMNPTDVGIMLVMLGLMVLMPLGFVFVPDNSRRVARYMAGIQVGDGASFKGSLDTREVTLRNHYLGGFLDESALLKAGVWAAVALLILFFLEVKP